MKSGQNGVLASLAPGTWWALPGFAWHGTLYGRAADGLDPGEQRLLTGHRR